jgi:hypothetical protein
MEKADEEADEEDLATLERCGWPLRLPDFRFLQLSQRNELSVYCAPTCEARLKLERRDLGSDIFS